MLSAATGDLTTSQAMSISHVNCKIRSPGLYLSDSMQILTTPNFGNIHKFVLLSAQFDLGTGNITPG